MPFPIAPQLTVASLCQGGPLDLDARPTRNSLALSLGDNNPPEMPTGEGIPGFIDTLPGDRVAAPMKKGEHWFTDLLSPVTAMKQLILKSYPDGTVSVTKKRQNVRVADSKTCRWNERDAARRMAMQALGGQELASLLGIEELGKQSDPFPCQESQKSNNAQKPLRTGLTGYGQKQLRRVFAAWEAKLSPGTCAFGTLTLSPDALSCLLSSGQSSPGEAYQKAVSMFMDRLRRLLRSRGLPGDVIWVTELHPFRSQREGIAIPHVHFVCQTADIKYQWKIKPSEIKHLWESAINYAAPHPEGKRFPSRCQIVCVKKSVARYVSKYLSKTKRCAIENTQNLNTALIPERWYAIANALHKLLRDAITVASGEEAATLLDWLKHRGNPIVKFSGDITIPHESGRPVWLASWFILRCHVDVEGMRTLMSTAN